ncbi:hypothetical protein CYMTET_32513 [Cymbomonas tetramitiformis]|uniref:Ubiquitin-like protease family profile domain-containing protein n=1 Tax=Cymbomonas tetramitiformis TaxID=36881 RepID=A0AAE0FFK3_9CHLO|nr:hypothetical protein CYMTET_32513 [Cymbomonas tetramitiformis]
MLAVLRGPAAGKLDGSALVFPSGFQTFGCTFACKAPSRQLYYELVILEPLDDPQFGFVDASFELSSASGGSGVGDLQHSWGVDGVRCCVWPRGSVVDGVGDAFKEKWKVGDVIGLAADPEKRTVTYFLNGQSKLRVSPDVIDFTLGVFPAFTADSGAVSVHMLAWEMRHMPPDHIAFGDECDLANVVQLDGCDLRVVEILAGRLAGRHSRCTLRLAATLGLSDITRLLLENGAESADAAGPVHEDLEDFFVTNVPADAETLRPAGEKLSGATLVERAPGAAGAGSAVEGALHALAPGEAATAEGLARMAVTRLQGHEGARTWGAPKALAEGGVSVYFVNGPDGRACAVREGEIHRSNNFSVRVSAAGELWYHCLAGTCSGRRRLQPPRADDEDAKLAGAPDVAETESRGAGERHAAGKGADGQATTTTAADDSPPLGRPAVGCAGVTGPERQRTTGKRRWSRASRDALGGDVDGRGVDVQRMVNGDSGERHAVLEDADELSVAEGQAKCPSVDERRPAGEGVDELDTAEWCAAGARTGERRPASGGAGFGSSLGAAGTVTGTSAGTLALEPPTPLAALGQHDPPAPSPEAGANPPEAPAVPGQQQVDWPMWQALHSPGDPTEEWLNDEVISLYLAVLQHRGLGLPGSHPRVYFFDALFYWHVVPTTDGVIDRARVRQRVATRGRGIDRGYDASKCKVFVMPVFSPNHWVLAVLDLRSGIATYFDSIPCGAKAPECLDHLCAVVNLMLAGSDTEGARKWTRATCTDAPCQDGPWDCGVFMLMGAERVAEDLPLDYSQDDVPAARMRITRAILDLGTTLT